MRPRKDTPFQTTTTADGVVYRRTVQVLLADQHHRLLVFTPVGQGNKAYVQPIQGGIEANETPMQAAVREANEEAGLDIATDAEFVCQLQAVDNKAAGDTQHAGATATHKDTSDMCAAFRYRSKAWRQYGVVGQEVWPLLFHVDEELIHKVHIRRGTATLRQEFVRASWCTPSEVVRRTPPRKQKVIGNIHAALVVHDKAFDTQQTSTQATPEVHTTTSLADNNKSTAPTQSAASNSQARNDTIQASAAPMHKGKGVRRRRHGQRTNAQTSSTHTTTTNMPSCKA